MKRINLQRIFIPLHFTKLLVLTLILCMMSCVTAQAENVTYIDESGNSRNADATVITSSTNTLSGWYVVKDTVETGGLTVAQNADAHIILASGGTLTITASNRGIERVDSEPGSLYIYGVGSNSGTLNINSSGTGINVLNYTQNGGTVNISATGTNALGISAAENVNINGGTLTINSNSYSIFAGDTAGDARSITITNGQIDADNTFVAGPVGTSTSDYVGTITLGLKDSSGYIKAGGYTAGTVKVADNQTLFSEDGTESYAGTLTSSQIANKKLIKGKLGIVQHAMILGSQIKVMFYVYFPNGYSSADYTMSFDVSGDISENPERLASTETITEGSDTLYGYPCYVNSVQMADTIHAALYDKDGKAILTEDYTAKTYLDSVIASADKFSSETVDLCKAIKDYGHYVQIPLAAEHKWVIGKKHKEMDAANTYNANDVSSAKDGAAAYALTKENAPTFTYALYLDSKTTLQVILEPEGGNTITDLACTNSDGSAIGDSLSIDTENNIVTIADISAHELGNFYKITGKATSDFTITISPLSYVHSVLNDTTEVVEGINNGVTSLYNYYDKTITYRKTNP